MCQYVMSYFERHENKVKHYKCLIKNRTSCNRLQKHNKTEHHKLAHTRLKIMFTLFPYEQFLDRPVIRSWEFSRKKVDTEYTPSKASKIIPGIFQEVTLGKFLGKTFERFPKAEVFL